MAKAAAVVRGASVSAGTVSVDLRVAMDNGQTFSMSTTVNFARSVTQLNSDVKAAVITEAAIPGRDQTLTANDIMLFGGAV